MSQKRIKSVTSKSSMQPLDALITRASSVMHQISKVITCKATKHEEAKLCRNLIPNLNFRCPWHEETKVYPNPIPGSNFLWFFES